MQKRSKSGDSLYCENTTSRRRSRRNRSFHYEGPQVPQVTYRKGREGNAFISKCLPSIGLQCMPRDVFFITLVSIIRNAEMCTSNIQSLQDFTDFQTIMIGKVRICKHNKWEACLDVTSVHYHYKIILPGYFIQIGDQNCKVSEFWT